jgi:hypothetical protein
MVSVTYPQTTGRSKSSAASDVPVLICRKSGLCPCKTVRILAVLFQIARAYRIVLRTQRACSTPMLGQKVPTATGNLRRLPTYPVQEPTTHSTWMTAVQSTKFFAITSYQTATTSLHPLEKTTWTALANVRTCCGARRLATLTENALSQVDWMGCLLAHAATAPILSSWYLSVL